MRISMKSLYIKNNYDKSVKITCKIFALVCNSVMAKRAYKVNQGKLQI